MCKTSDMAMTRNAREAGRAMGRRDGEEVVEERERERCGEKGRREREEAEEDEKGVKVWRAEAGWCVCKCEPGGVG